MSLGIEIYNVAIVVHQVSDFHPNFKLSRHLPHYKNVRVSDVPTSIWIMDRGFIQIIHHNTCNLIHKKCHDISYHNDIKYDMTLNTKI